MAAADGEGELKLVVDCGDVLGEGPVWDETQEALLWIDIEGKKLWRYGGPGLQEDGMGGELASWELPKRPGAFALRAQGRPGFLFAFEDGFALYNPMTDAPAPPEYLSKAQYVEGCEPYHQHGQVRLNDGRCDRGGRFVCGGYNGDEGDAERPWEAKCGVYILEGNDGGAITAREHFDFKVRCANSTAFSPDGATAYFADSPSREIWAFDYNTQQGRIQGATQRVFANIPEPGVPDGSCVDSAGALYNAEFFSGRLVRYRPDGSVDRVWRAPTASRLTCPCIGGPSMRTAFVTSASVGLEPGKEKGAGGIWAVRVDTAGLPETRFRG